MLEFKGNVTYLDKTDRNFHLGISVTMNHIINQKGKHCIRWIANDWSESLIFDL